MTKEYRHTVLNQALRQSMDGQLCIVLLDKDTAVIMHDERKAQNFVKMFGYRVYAKCKDGNLIL